jgi:hypothetical protein
MDSIFKRLKYYGVGFGIGLVFVLLFFQNRGCTWLPSNRVKNSILDRVLVLPEDQESALKQKGLSQEDIYLMLNTGEVNFKNSIKEGNPKVYALEKELKGSEMITMYFTLPKESFISEVHISENNASNIKNTLTGTGKLIHFPKDENLVFPDTLSKVTCQQEQLKLINPKDILFLLKRSGKIDFSKSQLRLTPKPEHYILFTDKKSREIGSQMIWYKNKLNVFNFDLPFENTCD